jgi:peptidoglycan/xylan/chitin deacetylase (PgdA/CDA1 family)
LALLVGLASVATLGAVRGLPVPRLPATAVIHLRIQLGAQAPGRHAPAAVGNAANPTSPPTPSPIPNQPQLVIPPGLTRVHVPILEYHYIRVNPNPRDRLGFNLSVTPANFQAQMDWLTAHGYHAIDLAALRAYFAGQVDLPAKPVVLTFDDGYRDLYSTAWPILRAHGFTAVSYVVPGFLAGKGYMTPDQVSQLGRAGIEIGSHTVHHVDLTKADPAALRIELEASKGYLEQLLGRPVLDFCYPSGRFNQTVEAAVEAAGYQSATTELPGTALSWANRLAWTRVRVAGGEQLSAFATSLGPSDPTQLVAKPRLPAPIPVPVASPSIRHRPGAFP